MFNWWRCSVVVRWYYQSQFSVTTLVRESCTLRVILEPIQTPSHRGVLIEGDFVLPDSYRFRGFPPSLG